MVGCQINLIKMSLVDPPALLLAVQPSSASAGLSLRIESKTFRCALPLLPPFLVPFVERAVFFFGRGIEFYYLGEPFFMEGNCFIKIKPSAAFDWGTF